MEAQTVAVSNDLTDTDTSEHKATVINKIILYKQSFTDPGIILSLHLLYHLMAIGGSKVVTVTIISHHH